MSKKKNYIGKQFRQDYLPSNLKHAKFGQHFLSKLAVSVVFLAILVFSSSLLGLLISTLSSFIFFPEQNSNPYNRFVSSYVLLSAISWICVTTFSGFANGLHFFLVATGGSLLSTFYLFVDSIKALKENFQPSLFITFPLSVTLMNMCIFGLFILIVYSLVLSNFLFIKWKNSYFLESFLAVSISILASLGFVFFSPDNKELISVAFTSTTVACGGFTCIFLLAIGSYITNEIDSELSTRCQHFTFLKKWSTYLGSWRGTSFYGLDLSGIDLQNTNLANVDLRAKKLLRTKLLGAIGLDKARVNSHYLDLDIRKVQILLTEYRCLDFDYRRLVLRGAYLKDIRIRETDFSYANLAESDFEEADLRSCQFKGTQLSYSNLCGADLRKANLTDANLTGANCRGANFCDAILTRTQIAQADFTGAILTGVCIEDWSVSSQTTFTDVHCNYVFKKHRNGDFSGRYPVGRIFDSHEFSTLFEKPDDNLEIVFPGDFSHSALSLTFEKLSITEPALNLVIRGIEQRDRLWIVTYSSTHPAIETHLRNRLSESSKENSEGIGLNTAIEKFIRNGYEEMKQHLQANEAQMNRLIGISATQADAVSQLSRKAFGTNLFILGGKITNLVGQGSIEYTEAANQVRELVVDDRNRETVTTRLAALLSEIQSRDKTETKSVQTELLQQVMLREIEADYSFRQSFLKNAPNIIETIPDGIMTTAVRSVLLAINES